MYVCMYVCSLCISTPYESVQPNFAWHTLGSREGQDRVGGTEREVGKVLPQFLINGGKIFGFLKNVENVLRFLRYLHLAFIYSHCPV